MVFHTFAVRLASELNFAVKRSPEEASTPTVSNSFGAGRYLSITCRRTLKPCTLMPEPISTGTMLQVFTLARRAPWISSTVKSSPEKNFSIYSSLVSATASSSAFLAMPRFFCT